MSSSCNPAIVPRVEALPYTEVSEPAAAAPTPSGSESRLPSVADILNTREAAARETGRQEGEAKARAACDARLAEIRDSVGLAIAEFSRQRTEYFQQVETEVVQLALSIARKILHRESQLDPLLLAGIASVALGKIGDKTKVKVRVNPQQAAECRAYFAQHMEAQEVPEVCEDPQLQPDYCVLETALGTTEIGIEVQLKEIEKGLFDLLEQRPKAGA